MCVRMTKSDINRIFLQNKNKDKIRNFLYECLSSSDRLSVKLRDPIYLTRLCEFGCISSKVFFKDILFNCTSVSSFQQTDVSVNSLVHLEKYLLTKPKSNNKYIVYLVSTL